MENYLLEEGDIDPIEKHLLLDRMESEEDQKNGDAIKYYPGKKKNLTSTPLKDQTDLGSGDELPKPFSSVDLSDDDGTASNDVSGRSSPMVAGLPTITITEDADPLEPEDIRVPILGYEVMDSRAKFTSHPKPTKILFRPPRLKGKTGMRTSILPNTINAPIVGYEIMEKRERTIVYKIEVLRYGYDRWFIFRRYNDFYTLNEQLKKLFPNFRLSLPPRRWFRSNYDKDFLEDRTLGLQTFLNNVTGHKDICNCKFVRDFFCFDDPPGPHDSLEESRALCENLEETIYILRKELSEKDEEVDILQEELSLFKNQVELLTRELKELKTNNAKTTIATSPGSNQLSLAECDQEIVDSDQSGNSDSNLTTDSDEKRNNPDKIPFKPNSSAPVVGPDVYTS